MHKETKQLPVEKLRVSPFNPRQERETGDIKELAEHIKSTGFRESRALWVYPKDEYYEVFAGGSRLEAVKLLEYETLPCVVHTDCTQEEISKLASLDNTDDELHKPVELVQMFREYHMLHQELGWSQSKIAEVKGVSQTRVSQRIKFYEHLPKKYLARVGTEQEVKQASLSEGANGKCITESHLKEILINYATSHNLSGWPSDEKVWSSLLRRVIGQAEIEESLSIRDTRDLVKETKAAMAKAEEIYNKLESEEQKEKFIKALKDDGRVTVEAVEQCERMVSRESVDWDDISRQIAEHNKLHPIPEGEFKNLDVESLIPHEWAQENIPQMEIDCWAGFLKSIKEHGIFHHIIVSDRTGKYVIVDGHERVRAAKKLGIKQVNALVRTFPNKMSEINNMITTNAFRREATDEEMEAMEEAAKSW